MIWIFYYINETLNINLKLIYIKDNLLNIIKEFIIIKIKWKIVVHPKKIKKL